MSPPGTRSWVIYHRAVDQYGQKGPAVCSQGEWDAIEKIWPGRHTLVQAGIPNEAEAERRARELAMPPTAPASLLPSR